MVPWKLCGKQFRAHRRCTVRSSRTITVAQTAKSTENAADEDSSGPRHGQWVIISP